MNVIVKTALTPQTTDYYYYHSSLETPLACNSFSLRAPKGTYLARKQILRGLSIRNVASSYPLVAITSSLSLSLSLDTRIIRYFRAPLPPPLIIAALQRSFPGCLIAPRVTSPSVCVCLGLLLGFIDLRRMCVCATTDERERERQWGPGCCSEFRGWLRSLLRK